MTPTMQDLFDRSIGGVLAQGEPATDRSGACCYRTSTGLKCAAGQLIPDDDYREAFEGAAFGITTEKTLQMRKAIGVTERDQVRLISHLQRAHDNAARYEQGDDFLNLFRQSARQAAHDFGLTTEVLDNDQP